MNSFSQSYVIWLSNGKFTIAWGETPEAARAQHLRDWEKSISSVEPTTEYHNPLPRVNYFEVPAATPFEPSIHQPLYTTPYQPDQVKPVAEQLAEQVAEAVLAALKERGL